VDGSRLCDEMKTRLQIKFCVERMDRVRRCHLAALRSLTTAGRLLPSAEAIPAPVVAERAAGQLEASSEGATIRAGAVGDDRPGPGEQAREPEGLVMFGGDEGQASPATKASRGRGRHRGAAT
jgi:hypothetical protein